MIKITGKLLIFLPTKLVSWYTSPCTTFSYYDTGHLYIVVKSKTHNLTNGILVM